MSQFPKRLIDELGEGDARRLLETARSDEPPAKLVAAAILTASESASAGVKAPDSNVRVSGSGNRRRNVALLAGALVIGAAAIVATTREAPGPTSTSESRSATPDIIGERPTAANTNVEEPATTASAEGTSVAELPDAPAPRVVAPAAKSVEQAADLLREANRLRARGQWAEAAATYRKVIDLGPDSPEAYPADVALGNLELQQGRPLPALARYEHALGKHPNGALSEEARWGRARALRSAGRTAEERAALEDFRNRHPDSPLAPVAAQRLAELGN